MYLNNPNAKYPKLLGVDANLPISRDVEDIVNAMKPNWSISNSLEIIELSGGITNKLYIVKNANAPAFDNSVIVRLYGAGTDLIIDRKSENSVFAQLSSRGIGPNFLGLFENGRVEQFIVDSKTLTVSDLSNSSVSLLIAESVAHLHSQDIILDNMGEVLWDTLVNFFKISQEHCTMQIADCSSSSGSAEDIASSCIMESNEWMRRTLSDNVLHDEISWLQSHLNILLQHSKRIVLIDYEYAGYNSCAYDIANHFCGMLIYFY